MNSRKNYCMNCMKEIDPSTVQCPHCEYNNDTPQHEPCLPKGSLIGQRYIVGKVISLANDSITYIGLDTETEETVEIHEFYPVKIVKRNSDKAEILVKLGCDAMYRNCLQSFINLWKGIGGIENEPALPKVKNILDYNGTVYTVCEYLDSITLKSFFEGSKKPLTWKGACVAFRPIFSALKALHGAGIIHGSVSPSSVQVGADKKLHLTSYSIPQCRSQVEALRVQPTHGFSPIEFYTEDGSAKNCSDIYSLMAVIYYSITGIVPPKATDRAIKDEMKIPSSVAGTLSQKNVTCFVKALAVQQGNRYQSIDQLTAALSAETAKPVVTTAQSVKEPQKPTVKKAEKPSPEKKKANNKKNTSAKGTASLVALALSTFTAVILLCLIVFTVLYTTVLYKNYDVPLLNEAFASWSFLPMNETQETYIETPQITTQAQKQENTYVTVPDFTAHTHDSIATNETFNKNFLFSFSYDWSDDVAKNAVISQSVTKGESVLSGTEIGIVISLGIEQIELPDVIGMDYEEAVKTLEDSKFVPTVKYIKNDGSYESLTVATMDKVAGLEFDKGSEIVLTVYSEYEEETTEEDAEAEETTKKSESDNSDNNSDE